MFRGFLYRASVFMEGRYGNDKFNTFLLILAGIVYVVNLFVRSPWLVLIALVLLILYACRALSKNINKRLYENRQFVKIYSTTSTSVKNQWMKIRDFKTHRYVKCPYCKSHLRLKKRTGVQAIHCPKCNEDFKKNILF